MLRQCSPIFVVLLFYFPFLGITVIGFSFEAREVARSNALTTTNLYSTILTDQSAALGNLVTSPYTFIIGLLALRSGSRGNIYEIIKTGLQLQNLNEDVIQSGFRDIINTFQGTQSASFVSLTKLLVSTDYTIKPEFVSSLNSWFNSSVSTVDFRNDTEITNEINAWENTSTIDTEAAARFSENFLVDTKGVLLSSTQFHGSWKKKFGFHSTRTGQFFLDNNDRRRVQMMNHDDYFHHANLPELDASAIMLPFQGDRFGMFVLLPNRRTGLRAMETKLTREYLITDIPRKLTRKWVEVWLPKFQINSQRDYLRDGTLTKLRLGSISYQIADFTGITCDNQLHFNHFIQAATLEINEEGSEGAQPTVSRVDKVSSGRSEAIIFNAEHPFLFFIYDHLTKSVLLLGRKIE